MKKYYLFVISIILSTTIAYSNSNLGDKISKTSSEYIEKHFMNGVYMFSIQDDVLHQGANGFFSIENKKELEILQQMPIASATKTMTAAAILKLQDRGVINVQDSVAKYLNDQSNIWQNNKVPEWANQVTLHNLLTHRSGIAEYFMNMQLDVKKPHVKINQDIANFAAGQELAFKPGEKHHYCNTNFVLLGLIIEQVSGKKLGMFYEEEFFAPLGLSNTRLATLDEAIQNQSNFENLDYPARYFVTPTGSKPQFTPAKTPFFMIPFADGGVISTTADLIKWNQALHSGKVLSEESYKLMIKKHYKAKKKYDLNSYIGYGLIISELENGDVMYGHPGKAIGIRSESGCIPNKNLCFAVLSNVMEYVPKEMQGKIDLSKTENKLGIHHFVQNILKSISR